LLHHSSSYCCYQQLNLKLALLGTIKTNAFDFEIRRLIFRISRFFWSNSAVWVFTANLVRPGFHHVLPVSIAQPLGYLHPRVLVRAATFVWAVPETRLELQPAVKVTSS
jgi:hypothetical protein